MSDPERILLSRSAGVGSPVTPGNGLLTARVSRALNDRGWWHGTGLVTEPMVRSLQQELATLMEADRLHRAGVGRDQDFQMANRIRRDSIAWLTRERPVQAGFLGWVEQLRLALNRETFLGLFEFEGHFALYPPGGFYRRHLDSFRGAASRVLSMVVYLTPDWQPGDGGELVIYAEDTDQRVATIEPRAGTLVLFLSERIPHEVLATQTERTSIAGWFRVNASIGNQIDPAR